MVGHVAWPRDRVRAVASPQHTHGHSEAGRARRCTQSMLKARLLSVLRRLVFGTLMSCDLMYISHLRSTKRTHDAFVLQALISSGPRGPPGSLLQGCLLGAHSHETAAAGSVSRTQLPTRSSAPCVGLLWPRAPAAHILISACSFLSDSRFSQRLSTAVFIHIF